MTKVAIIIVNWNTGKLLAACLRSIYLLPPEEQELIGAVLVVDNHSTDQSISFAKREATANTKFIELQENVGFARANNMAIKMAQGESNDSHILLLNPDTEVKKGSIMALVQKLESDPRIGIVGPRLLNPDGTPQPSVRTFPTLASLMFVFLKLQHLLPKAAVWREYMMDDFDYSKESDVNQVMGAAFLIRNAVIKDVGLLDERFWIWFEEVDYCLMAKNNEWRVVYTPQAEIIHYGGVSFNQLVGYRRSLPFLHSALQYAYKNLGSVATVGLVALLPIAFLLVIPASVIKRMNKNRGQKKL